MATCTSVADAHSWLVKPVSRETGPRTTDGTIGCPNSTPKTPTSFSPGETIDVRYWRNNHLGGFIRWAISPVGSETAEDFDNNVFYYTCRESGPDCVPNNGGDNIYAGDNSGDNTISCGDTITLPDWLDAGDYVLQWTWFGVGSSYGNIGWAEPQFISCADITLTDDGSSSAAPSCPTFVGGDRVTDMEGKGDDVCWYYYTNEIVADQYKGSNDQSAYEPLYMFGKPADVESCSGGSTSTGNSTTTDAPETESPTETPSATTTTPTESESSVGGESSNDAEEDPDTEAPETDAPGTETPETEAPAAGCKVRRGRK